MQDPDIMFQITFCRLNKLLGMYKELCCIKKIASRYFMEFIGLIFQRVNFVFIYKLGDQNATFKETQEQYNDKATQNNFDAFSSLIQ